MDVWTLTVCACLQAGHRRCFSGCPSVLAGLKWPLLWWCRRWGGRRTQELTSLSPAAFVGSEPGPSTQSAERTKRGGAMQTKWHVWVFIKEKTSTSKVCKHKIKHATRTDGVYLWERVRGMVPDQQAQIGLVVEVQGKVWEGFQGGATGTFCSGLPQVHDCVLKPLLSVV